MTGQTIWPVFFDYFDQCCKNLHHFLLFYFEPKTENEVNNLNKKTRQSALRHRQLNRYKRLQQLLVLLISKPELLHGRHSHTQIMNHLRQKGINCCYNTITTYYKLLRISKSQREIIDKNINALHKLKPHT